MAITLTTTTLLTDVIKAFAKACPQLFTLSLDMNAAGVMFNQPAIAKIRKDPTVASYDASAGGYKNGATETNTLLEDVPVLIDQWKHVPLKVSHLSQVANKLTDYMGAVESTARVLGKYMFDFVMSKVVAANFTNATTEAVATTDWETLGLITKAMNGRGCSENGRHMLVNSDVMQSLGNDPRIINSQFAGQLPSTAFGSFSRLRGFETIQEYPDLPSMGNMTAFAYEPRALVLSTRLPMDFTKVAAAWGIPVTAKVEVVRDPSTGFSLMGISWMENGTMDAYFSIAVMYGVTAGANGGSAGTIFDKGGQRLISA